MFWLVVPLLIGVLSAQSHPAPVARLLRATEVAERLSLSKSKAHELLATGELTCVRIGRSVRCTQEALDTYIHRHTITPQSDDAA